MPKAAIDSLQSTRHLRDSSFNWFKDMVQGTHTDQWSPGQSQILGTPNSRPTSYPQGIDGLKPCLPLQGWHLGHGEPGVCLGSPVRLNRCVTTTNIMTAAKYEHQPILNIYTVPEPQWQTSPSTTWKKSYLGIQIQFCPWEGSH